MAARKRKLIEVALPLEVINAESAREKSIRHGHPSTLHLWWARRPLAACRAVIFAQLVDDPSSRPEEFPTVEAQEKERKRLLRLIERLVPWEATRDERVLAEARAEIRKSCGDDLPPILDPFCGGGSIPLEAQRLGLEAHASDLNPVAVLITKALVEIPPRFANLPPVNPQDRESRIEDGWRGAEGLAADVRYYGQWMREQAEKRIGHLYPKAKLPDETEATVIAWLWARTVTCPNPACAATMPLARSFWLGKKRGKEAWVEPVVEDKRVRFEICHGPQGPSPDGTVGRTGAVCLACSSPVPLSYIRAEGKAGRMGAQLMAIAAEGDRQRIYLSPSEEHALAARVKSPDDVPDMGLPRNPRDFKTPNYGLTKFSDLFTDRQLVALATFSKVTGEVCERIVRDALSAGISSCKEKSYADAMVAYMALAVDRSVDRGSSICGWDSSPKMEGLRNTFSRQAVPMTWDFAEGNPFSESSGNFADSVEFVGRVVERLGWGVAGSVRQADATADGALSGGVIVATDPPYYDNIGYADLSDFFYVWLRRSLRTVYPDLFATVLTPKERELVANPYRFGGDRDAAQRHFEEGLGRVFTQIYASQAGRYPVSIFYAFKQAETGGADGAVASTGWEKMLESLIRSGLAITGTWPVRTELGNRILGNGTNALASSIVLVCRAREPDAGVTDRRGFLGVLRDELPDALRELQQGSIAAVDLAQAAIGPGMAIFTRYRGVLEPDGEPMRVRTALGLINQVLDEVLAEQEGELDPGTRWAVRWFEQYGYSGGPYGQAEVLATAQAVSIAAMRRAGILRSKAGRVVLLGHGDMSDGWEPPTDTAPTVWEVTHRLIKHLDEGGERAAGELLRGVGGLGEMTRDLAYRLYRICERKRWASQAVAFNGLVASWREIEHAAEESERAGAPEHTQGVIDD